MPDWTIYDGSAGYLPREAIEERWLNRAPPWRERKGVKEVTRSLDGREDGWKLRGQRYVSSGADEIYRVNIALLLRRPILVTGRPGVGKSTLAYNIAWSLGLGPPLRWEINSQTSLKDGLYSYDAIGHLRAHQVQGGHPKQGRVQPLDVGAYVTLGPLGTALLPTRFPRVLLVDELDKSSFDLPNDLLNVFEEGAFHIPELVRGGGVAEVHAFDAVPGERRISLPEGRVATRHHPVVVITSNGEREFPEAFRRRCVPLDLQFPDVDVLRRVVRQQLGDSVPTDLVDDALRNYRDTPTDALLQEVFLRHVHQVPANVARPATQRAEDGRSD